MRFADRGGGGTSALTAVQDVSFALADGEVVSLIGPSGCGKSTLLNIGSGLTVPSEGIALVDGERVAGPNAHVAFMLQKDLLLPWRTVAENVMFGVEIQGLPAKERKQRAEALLAGFNLADFSQHYPHQLSGGMRQRVALARTLAVDPHVLLLDEPFSAVDAQTRMVLQRDLAHTLKQAGKTALLITHDLGLARAHAQRIVVMHAGQIVENAPTKDLFSCPRHPYTALLIGATPATAAGVGDLAAIPGSMPDLSRHVPPCRFADRCVRADAPCRTTRPPWAARGAHGFACVHPL